MRIPFLLLWCFILSLSPARADFLGHGGMVRSVALSADGTRVLTAGFDSTVRLWQFAAQTPAGLWSGHEGPVSAALFIGDGQQAVSAANDGRILIWDVKSGLTVGQLSGQGDRIVALAVSVDGQWAASAGWDRQIRIWDIPNRRQRNTLSVNHDATALVFAGDTLFSGHKDGSLQAWDVKTGATRGVDFPRHDMGVTALVAVGDARLLSASIDGTVRLWNAQNGVPVHEMKGHEGPVFALALRPHSQAALSVGRDGRLLSWDLKTGRALHRLAVHDGPAWGVAVTPDGRFALTAGSDGSVRVWHLDSNARIGMPDEGKDEPKPWLSSDHPGARLYRTCAVCHALDAASGRRSGPHLAGLFGREVGSVKGYPYSSALQDKKFRWDETNLFALFSDGPDVFLPGTKMPVQRVTDPQDLHNLISYLRDVTR